MSQETRNLKIPFIGMAFYIGWRYFKPFPIQHPSDYEQTCVLCALSVRDIGNDREAFNTISRMFIRIMREYGYTKTEDGRWVNRQLIFTENAQNYDKRCALCKSAGVRLDKKYGRLCRRHHLYIDRRRKHGDANPYKGIESLDNKKTAAHVVLCAQCGQGRREYIKRIAERVNHFCNQKCYQAYRRGEQATTPRSGAVGIAFVTPHAVQRFQERVADLEYNYALAAIIEGLENPVSSQISGHQKGLVVSVQHPYRFRAVLMPGGKGKPVVATILPDIEVATQAKQRRKNRREHERMVA